MNGLVLGAATALLLVADAFAGPLSSAPVQSTFATASISAASGRAGSGEIRVQPGGGFTARNATLRELVAYAFQRQRFDRREVTGGPAWIDTARFDVDARAPAEHAFDPDGSLRGTWSMLRALLADRFKLKVHEEDREQAIYALRLARPDGALGPGLRKTDVDCGAAMTGGRPSLPPGKAPPCSTKTPPGRLFANTVTMAAIASLLSAHIDRPVVDQTGLADRFDLELEAREIEAPPGYKPGPSDLALPPARGPSIFTAVREQLGLTLDPENGTVPVVVIDHAEMPAID